MRLDEARLLFPVSRRWTYFNHAAVSPLATPTRQAMERLLAELNTDGAQHWREWISALEAARATLGLLVGAPPSAIALTKNTSEGLALVAQGLDWHAGDRIVTFECEFPANLYPWLALRARGVQVELLPEAALGDLDRIRAACRGARMLSVSFVQYLGGFRSDLDALGAICREAGALFVVDGIQGLGAFPVQVERSGIHLLAADGHKWLTGPEGAAFTYLAPELMAQLTPHEVGWTSVENWDDFSQLDRAARQSGPLQWRAGAARFECGTLNTVGTLGLGAAVELLRAVGIETIAAHLLSLGARLGDGLRARGAELYRDADPAERRSGITSFRLPGARADDVVAQLEACKIQCASRQGWVRCSPHLYNTTDEVDRLLANLPAR